MRVDGRPGSSLLFPQTLNPPDRVTASLFTSAASSAPPLTSNQTRSDTRYLWILCLSPITANHSKCRCARVFSPFHLFPVVGRELQTRHLLVFLSRKMERHDRFKLLLLFQCAQTDLSWNPWVHVHWLFPPAVSSDSEHSADALPLTQIQDIDVYPRFSPHSLFQALFGVIAAYLHGPFAKSPPWQTELSPFCLFMPKIWFSLTYFHILFGCNVSFTSLKLGCS